MTNVRNPIPVSAIIVNYKSGSYAAECIRSLLEQDIDGLEIIVVDNDSRDDSVKTLRATFGEQIVVIENQENLGFGRANNLAASVANGDFLLLINPDTKLLNTNAISALVSYLTQNNDMGIVGPEIHEPSKNKFVLPRTQYPSAKRLRHTSKIKSLPGKYAWILGACMAMRKKVFQEIGGFDPDFFLYGEDADICLRLRLAGYQVGYCDAAKITHVGGGSEQESTSLDKYLRKKRGFFLFCRKHYAAKDIAHIARMSLATTCLGFMKVAIRGFLGVGKRQGSLDQQQRLEAARIVAGEVLDELKETR
ncbi:MAG TPA: glycosyltransferase family 2 protein [Novimethylophilus sp.]|jgi:hypothetical protein|uniref:glycosyltransferase family 2 protein n=1 Tax=Novimethylophilus sp. TaxID=2137426 RepID=UPI002F3ECE23